MGIYIGSLTYVELYKRKYSLVDTFNVSLVLEEYDKFKNAYCGEYYTIQLETGNFIEIKNVVGGVRLVVSKGYTTDGASGPALDTKSFMRPSVLHDAFYSMMRKGFLDPTFRKTADKILKRMCLHDGMPRLRAWYVYRAVRAFSKKYTLPDEHIKKIGTNGMEFVK
ncbi:MAG: DUF1353 domain-containing protein [Proteobacteria bacterium]|nr:DUF1353 domain-containing protein [Pseudomonadota bacterium]